MALDRYDRAVKRLPTRHCARTLALVAVGALVASGCGGGQGSSGGPSTIKPSADINYYDATVTRELRGETRSIGVDARVPSGSGPFPTLVFGHGLGGEPDLFNDLFRKLNDAGYAVIAPVFPKTSMDSSPSIDQAARLADLVNQPADITAVMDWVFSADGPGWASRIAHDRLAVGGLSMGGGTAMLVGYNSCCVDDRFKAAVVYAPLLISPGDHPTIIDGQPPLLLIHGTADQVVPISSSDALFSGAIGDSTYIRLEGGTHAAPFDRDASPFDELVADATLAFLDRTIGPDGGSGDLDALVNAAGNATIEHAED